MGVGMGSPQIRDAVSASGKHVKAPQQHSPNRAPGFPLGEGLKGEAIAVH